MGSALKSGSVYFLLVYVAGFLLGTLRVLTLAPMLGEMVATLIELPVILLFSWLACRLLIGLFSVPATLIARITMGATALVLLLAAEIPISIFLLDRSIHEHFAIYQTAQGLFGLAGQIVFALFPIVQLITTRTGVQMAD